MLRTWGQLQESCAAYSSSVLLSVNKNKDGGENQQSRESEREGKREMGE